MKISHAEQIAIRAVLTYGEMWGYGNLISHLQTAWARKLVSDGIPEREARLAAGGEGMPFKMQDDLIERGEWDETGARYFSGTRRTHGLCPHCGGSGVVADMAKINRTGDPHINRKCRTCKGTGKLKQSARQSAETETP